MERLASFLEFFFYFPSVFCKFAIHKPYNQRTFMKSKFTKSLNWRLMLLTGLLMLANLGVNATKITRMRCEYQTSPINIDSPNPRLTWNYIDGDAFVQGSSRILIATDKKSLGKQGSKGFIFDSNLVAGNKAEFICNTALKPFTRYYWQVIACDKNGRDKVKSAIASFETAMTSPSEWHAKWISDSHDKDFYPAPMLRKAFNIQGKIKQARLYVSAAAYAKMEINGKAVTSAVLNPGYTHYDKRNLYDAIDVTALLNAGENVVSAVLGNGFYNEIANVATWSFEKARWRNRARLICQLRITLNDGTVQEIGSDGSWKTSTGPYIMNNIYSGDTYDATKEIPGWDKPGFNDAQWADATVVDAPSPLLVAQNNPPITVDREISAVDFKAFGDTMYVYNFGVNMSGFCRLNVKGEKGTKITLKHGEIQRPNGRLETGNIDVYYKPQPDVQFQTDTYILDGNNDEFVPNFNYHGFQYVEVRCDRPVTLTQESLKAQFFHTAVARTGDFSCSNDLLNKLWAAANQSYLSNLMSIPTDCPQREKNGWTADAHISQDLGLLNFDGITFYEKWINDMTDNITAQGRVSGIIPSSGWGYDDWIGPVWDAAIFIVPMNLYRYYGETRGIEAIWPTCEKYLKYLQGRENADKTVTYGIGDWVFYKTQTPTDYTTTCYYYLDNQYMAQFAKLIGKDGAKYAAKAEELKALINRKYFDKDKALYANGSQASQGVALFLGLVPAGYEQKVADNLSAMIEANGNYLDCGMLGSKTIIRMLAKYGHADQAFAIATKDEAPAWGNWIKKGLKALPETWKLSPDFRDASLNHVFLGDINAWMYNVLAGINYDEKTPGFKHILIQPHFVKGLDWVKAEYNSANGLIRSSWTRQGDNVVLNVTIPDNTTATIEANGKKMDVAAGNHQFKF
jgi:alpha-L-rhamnosidase